MIPQKLRDLDFWCVWRREIRGGKPTKVPYNPHTGGRAETNNPSTFGSFDLADERYMTEDYDGVGIRLSYGISAVDIDHCVNDGVIDERAMDIIGRLRSYTEFSPSKTGIRIIFEAPNLVYDAEKYYLKNPSNGVEIYVCGATNRFVTMTGNVAYGYPVRDVTDDLTAVLEDYMVRPKKRPGGALKSDSGPIRAELSDDEIIDKACRNDKFRALFVDGDLSDNDNDHSSADLALCNMLAFWTGRNEEQMDRLFRRSALYRESKWNRQDYSRNTINLAIADCDEVYDPSATTAESIYERVAQYNDAMGLKRYIMSVKRNADPTVIAEALSQPALVGRFSKEVMKTIQKAAESPPTESQIVDEIIKKRNIIYVDQVGFYEWNGRVWSKISDGVVKNYADTLYGKRFATAQRVASACNLLKSRTICETKFDRNPVVTFQNGTLEIETGKFRNFSEADYCSICMDYDYDPSAQCPTWEHFIEDVTDGEPHRQEILQFMAGYVLMNDCRFQKIFLLIGSGGNGKSVYLEVIQKLFGDKNVTHVEPTGLAKEFERIRLKDSLLNIGSDINSDFSRGEIREWLLKVADGTSVQACYKGLNHIDFIPRCKLVYACNAMPTAEIINGLNRRLQFVDFPCQYVETPDPNDPKQKRRDINIIGKLHKELTGIFNWAYAGYKLLNTVGYFSDAPEQQAFMEQFEQTSNPVIVFCEDYNYSGTVSRETIYEDYKNWCISTGHKPFSREKFMPRFREVMGDRITEEKQKQVSGARTRVFVIQPVH